MFISLQELESRTVRFRLDVPAGDIDYDGKITQASPLHAEGTAQLLSHSLGEIRVEGNLAVTVNAPCDRCLETAEVGIRKSFDLVYMPAEEQKSGGEAEVDEKGVEIGYYEGSGLELNDALREVVLLALPMQMVCSETCKGICPACGQNRNQQDCGCHPVPLDDRWSKLRDFKAESGPRN
jgi:uncharacterized protein